MGYRKRFDRTKRTTSPSSGEEKEKVEEGKEKEINVLNKRKHSLQNIMQSVLKTEAHSEARLFRFALPRNKGV